LFATLFYSQCWEWNPGPVPGGGDGGGRFPNKLYHHLHTTGFVYQDHLEPASKLLTTYGLIRLFV
jgi:hypothetical protein